MKCEPKKDNQVQVAVLGDGAVGKTSLIVTFTKGEFPTSYVPTIWDAFRGSLQCGDQEVLMSLYDTAGSCDLYRLRPIVYPGTDVFLICFDHSSLESFKSAYTQWKQEIDTLGPANAVKILVGLKKDLRDDLLVTGKSIITTEEGHRIKEQYKFDAYVECSAKAHDNVNEVFQTAL